MEKIRRRPVERGVKIHKEERFAVIWANDDVLRVKHECLDVDFVQVLQLAGGEDHSDVIHPHLYPHRVDKQEPQDSQVYQVVDLKVELMPIIFIHIICSATYLKRSLYHYRLIYYTIIELLTLPEDMA